MIFSKSNPFFVDCLTDLDEQEKKRLLDPVSGLDRIMILLLLETGLYVEDLIGLRVSDVDLQGGYVRSASGQRLQISDRTQEELRHYLKSRPDKSYLFEGRCGKPVTAKWKRCVLERLLHAAGDREHRQPSL